MRPIRTAILGCGFFGRRHAELLLTMPEQVELVAFCDRHDDRARAYAAQYNPRAAVYTDQRRLLDEARLDLLVITLPPYGHQDEVEQAAEHGVNVLIEKPVALTSEHAWRMVEAAEKAGIKTQVGLNLRFGAAVRLLRDKIVTGEAGQPGLMTARYFCNSLHNAWWPKREKSGGQMLEQVIHLIDLMRFFLGEAVSVYSVQNNLYHRDDPGYSVEDVSGTIITFQNGAVGLVAATNNAVPEQWIYDCKVVTRAITAELDDANHGRFTYTSTPDLKTEQVASEENFYRLMLLNLLEAIQTGAETLTPLREGARSLDLALAANASAETKTVKYL